MVSISLVRCIAKLSGDGYVNHRAIRYNNTCVELREEFKEDIQQEFGVVHFTEGITNSGTPFVHVSGKRFVSLFYQYLEDYRSNAIHIPKEVVNSDSSLKREYLRAFYDDEGCVALRIFSKTKEWKRGITLTSNSLQILNEVKKILIEDFSIDSNKIIKNHAKSKRDSAYVLGITGKGNILKFKESIGFKHPKKVKKLDLMIRTFKITSKHRDEFERLKMELSIP
ncbi:MAG TPA: LAGLIDADG family homing endonuclease [Candidatus Nanoarchaeia archaeon]|nr:LAGLIDADG family homing endonuclease [Candidatus Nanoarchaeia archaeon]